MGVPWGQTAGFGSAAKGGERGLRASNALKAVLGKCDPDGPGGKCRYALCFAYKASVGQLFSRANVCPAVRPGAE